MSGRRGFGSDNHAGVHPEVLSAICEANVGHAVAYGDDEWTRRAQDAVREVLGGGQVAFVLNGTGANVVSLGAVCRPWESVICAESAHINTDECAAPEHIANVKLVTVPSADGKLTPESVRGALVDFGFEHHAQPRVISVSNVSEFGTIYTRDELRALSTLAHDHGMLLHCDGARLANAAAGLGCSLAALTSEAGVDVLSLGGTKNGMLAGEAVVLFGDAETDALSYVRKQSGQLASKMRFISAQFIAMYGGDLWLRCAAHANAAARKLADGFAECGVEIAYPVQANEVFAWLPSGAVASLGDRFGVAAHPDVPSGDGCSLVRWVGAWDTRDEDVQAALSAVSAL